LLNWAARYYPILRCLKKHGLLSQGDILEIGSGPTGIGRFRRVPFTGVDLSFPGPSKYPMTQLVASAAQLPVADKSFDAVVASDVLEHISPDLRAQVIEEALRVARKLVIFGFPCGVPAHDSDRSLFMFYQESGLEPPAWLQEHMLAPFPEVDLFQALPGWTVTQFGNESIAFHSWMVRKEMKRSFRLLMKVCMLFLPSRIETMLRRADSEPYYRQIFEVRRAS
jgi:hypothetical protein